MPASVMRVIHSPSPLSLELGLICAVQGLWRKSSHAYGCVDRGICAHACMNCLAEQGPEWRMLQMCGTTSRGIRTAEGLQLLETCAGIKSTVDEMSIELRNLQNQLARVLCAAAAVAGEERSGHTDVDADNITADVMYMDHMKTVLNESSTDRLQKSI